jgi:DNA-binding CsgD family transcriptional regulator
MAVALPPQLRGITRVVTAADGAEVLRVLGAGPVVLAVIEADGVPWSVPEVVGALRAQPSSAVVVGLSRSGRSAGADDLRVLRRQVAPTLLAEVLQPGYDREPPLLLSVTATDRAGSLTPHQRQVLALLSLGFTAAQIAARLGVSERRISKTKGALFVKLGVQTQAAAVAAALSAGLLGPAG